MGIPKKQLENGGKTLFEGKMVVNIFEIIKNKPRNAGNVKYSPKLSKLKK